MGAETYPDNLWYGLMTLIIPDPRWEEPNLLIPGRKPVGPVTIDWSHPLANGLTVCILFQSPEPRNLVDGAALTKSGGAYFTPDGQYFDEVDDYYTLPNVTMTSGNTILTHTNFTDNAGSFFQVFFSFGAALGSNTLNMYLGETSQATVPDQLVVATGAATSEFNFWSSLNNKPLAHVFNSSGSPRSRLWVGGDEISQISDSSTWPSSPQTRTLYIGAREDLNADRFFGGTLKYLYIYGAKVLSPAEIVSLNRNPYQFLIPA